MDANICKPIVKRKKFLFWEYDDVVSDGHGWVYKNQDNRHCVKCDVYELRITDTRGTPGVSSYKYTYWVQAYPWTSNY